MPQEINTVTSKELEDLIAALGQPTAAPQDSNRFLPQPAGAAPRDIPVSAPVQSAPPTTGSPISFYQQEMERIRNLPAPEETKQDVGGISALLDILGGMGSGEGESFATALGRSNRAYKEGRKTAENLRQKRELDKLNTLMELYEKDRSFGQRKRELDIKERGMFAKGEKKLPAADIQLLNYYTENLGMTPKEAVEKKAELEAKGKDVNKQILDAAVTLESKSVRKAGTPVDLMPSVEGIIEAMEALNYNESGDVRDTIENINKPSLEKFSDIYDD